MCTIDDMATYGRKISLSTKEDKMVKKRDLLTPKEAEEFLRVKGKTLREMDKEIKPYKVGSQRRYTYEMLLEYLEGTKKR